MRSGGYCVQMSAFIMMASGFLVQSILLWTIVTTMPLLYNWSHYLTVFRCLLEKIERTGLFYYFSIFLFDEKINTWFGRKQTAVNYMDQL